MERLLQELDFENNRFLFLYGEGIQDCFLSSDYREMAILESLWWILKSKKFECVLFFSHTDRIFFFDAQSQAHCRAPRGKGLPVPDGQQKPETIRPPKSKIDLKDDAIKTPRPQPQKERLTKPVTPKVNRSQPPKQTSPKPQPPTTSTPPKKGTIK